MISQLLLEEFNRYLSGHTGLYFPKEKWPQLVNGLAGAAQEFGCETPEKCIHWLMSADLTERQVEILAGYLTVGETYFFRDNKSFDVLANIILPELIQTRQYGEKRLRLWSAACSTGEEAYSIAMVLDRKKIELKDFNIHILATDINWKALKIAREGVYGEWSFRDTPPWVKGLYFTREEKKRYRILPHLRDKVVFDYYNLVTNSCPSLINKSAGMDVIFCRNVLMYFEPEVAKKVVAHLYRCLAPGGWLIVGPTDAFNVVAPGLMRADIPGAPVYRKMPVKATPDGAHCDAAVTVSAAPGPAFYPPIPPIPPDAPIPPTGASGIGRPQENNRETAESHYKEALELYRQGFYAKAADILESLPEPSAASAAPGPGNNGAGDFRQTHVFQLLARVHANQGKLETAEKWCIKAVASAPLDPQYRYLLASIRLEQGKIEAATAALKQCLYIDPDFIPAHFTLGHIARQKGNHAEANRCFDTCLSLLNNLDPGAAVMGADQWLTAGRLREMIMNMMEKGPYYG